VTALSYLDAAELRDALPWEVAVPGLEAALTSGLDPEEDGPRLFTPIPNGEFLLMPAATATAAGIKVLTLAPENPARGLQKVQGTYLLFDADTSAPLAAMDGTELTAIRTPAVTMVGLRALAAAAPEENPFPHAPRVLVIGAGVQALNHARAAAWVWPGATFLISGRRPERVAELVDTLRGERITADAADGGLEEAVRGADVIITVTTSSEPLFPGEWVADGALVAAVGQHGLDAREVDAALVHRADVLVEGRASALAEAGDLIPARSAEEWERIAPPNLADGVSGRLTRRPGAPALYCGVGMSWEDLVLADLAARAGSGGPITGAPVTGSPAHGDARTAPDPAASGSDVPRPEAPGTDASTPAPQTKEGRDSA